MLANRWVCAVHGPILRHFNLMPHNTILVVPPPPTGRQHSHWIHDGIVLVSFLMEFLFHRKLLRTTMLLALNVLRNGLQCKTNTHFTHASNANTHSHPFPIQNGRKPTKQNQIGEYKIIVQFLCACSGCSVQFECDADEFTVFARENNWTWPRSLCASLVRYDLFVFRFSCALFIPLASESPKTYFLDCVPLRFFFEYCDAVRGWLLPNALSLFIRL